MARSCKCKICGKILSTDIAYKITMKNGTNTYYCSEEEYNQMLEEKKVNQVAKCQICGKQICKCDAYKITKTSKDGRKTNFYYCSEEEFNDLKLKQKQRQEQRDRVYWFICDMFGYKIINTKFFDEWDVWNKLKTDDILYQFLRENEEYLCDILNKHFETEYNKIRYFSAVIKNKLADFNPKAKVIESIPNIITEEHYETKYKPKERKALIDFEEEYDE